MQFVPLLLKFILEIDILKYITILDIEGVEVVLGLGNGDGVCREDSIAPVGGPSCKEIRDSKPYITSSKVVCIEAPLFKSSDFRPLLPSHSHVLDINLFSSSISDTPLFKGYLDLRW